MEEFQTRKIQELEGNEDLDFAGHDSQFQNQ